jgi:hypothetical protein
MLLGCVADVTHWNDQGTECSLMLKNSNNPLLEFVEIPETLLSQGLLYNNLICGIIRGSLQQIQLSVVCEIINSNNNISNLQGEEEIRIKLKQILTEQYNDEDS